MRPLILLDPDNGEMDIFPAELVPDADHFVRVKRAKPYDKHSLRIDGAAFCALIECFCEKYFDESLAKSYRYYDSCTTSFEYFYDNVLTYEQVHAMLTEIEQVADAVMNEKREYIPDDMVSHINQYLFGIFTPKITSEELLVQFKREIADYLRSFCNVVWELMANAPDYQYIDFQGP